MIYWHFNFLSKWINDFPTGKNSSIDHLSEKFNSLKQKMKRIEMFTFICKEIELNAVEMKIEFELDILLGTGVDVYMFSRKQRSFFFLLVMLKLGIYIEFPISICKRHNSWRDWQTQSIRRRLSPFCNAVHVLAHEKFIKIIYTNGFS